MLVGFALFFLIAPLRDFFELTPLSWSDVLVTGILALVWMGLVRVLWHSGIYERMLAEIHRMRARGGRQPAD